MKIFKSRSNLFGAIFTFVFCLLLLLPSEAEAGFIVQRPLYMGLGSGLVGSWSFDGPDMSGTTAYDRSGQGNNGTLTNGPVRSIGRIGQGLSFDGVNDRVETPISSALDITGTQISFALWVKMADVAAGADKALLSKAWTDNSMASPYYQYAIEVNNLAGNDPADCMFSDGTLRIVEGTSDISDNTWKHIACVYNGSTFRVYVNGKLENSANFTQSISSRSTKLKIAVDSNNSQLTNGIFDDVRIYNRALTQDEITRLYRVGATLKINKPAYTDSLQSGLVGSWSFDGPDMSGNTAYDRSGQGNNGTLTNGPVRSIGRIGQGLSFDGVDDYVNLPIAVGIVGTNLGSISMWFKTTDTDGFLYDQMEAWGTKDPASDYDYVDIAMVASKVRFRFTVFTDPVTITSSNNYNDGVWHFLTATRIGTHDGKLYIDGNLIGSDNSASGGSGIDSAGIINLGRESNGTNYFNGLIDDIRIYNRALSADEITRLYRVGATLKINKPNYSDSLQSGLVGSWSFDGPDMAGNTAYDRSGQGNNGTLTNGPVRSIGRIGQALSFDGVDDYVAAGTSLDVVFPFSVSAWVFPLDRADYHTIFSKLTTWSGSGHRIHIGLNITTGRVYAFASGSNHVSTYAPPLTTWTHLGMVFRSGVGIDLYVNGVFNQTIGSGVTLGTGSTANVRMGTAGDGDDPFAGPLDDIRIYNRALSADEITRLYNAGK